MPSFSSTFSFFYLFLSLSNEMIMEVFFQRFLSSYLTLNFEMLYNYQVGQVVLCSEEPTMYCLSVSLFVHFSFSLQCNEYRYFRQRAVHQYSVHSVAIY